MVTSKELRTEFTVNDIKCIGYSMIDSIYDIVFNTGHCRITNEFINPWNDQSDILLKHSIDDRTVNAIHEQMAKDMIRAFPNKIEDRNFHCLVREFIKSYYNLAIRAIRGYTKNLIQGRLYPDDIATNGCKAAYLFVHERHPKHKLNSSAKEEIELIVDDFFGREKNLGEL